MDRKVKSGVELIVPVHALGYLSSYWLSMFAVGEGVYVGSKARRRGCIDTGNMVIGTDLGEQSY